MIAGIDSKGSCFGYTVWTGENVNLSLFGDDASTFVKDGFEEGEYVSFVKYSLASGSFENLNVAFDLSYTHSDGSFVSNGVSVMKAMGASSANSESANLESIRVYPNPVREQLVIQANSLQNVSFTVFNMQGQEILSGDLMGENTLIDVSELVKGMYLIHFDGQGQKRIERIVKY